MGNSLRDEYLGVLTPNIRLDYFSATGNYGSDAEILNWYSSTSPSINPCIHIPHNTDGGKTTFYDIEHCKDLDDLSEHWVLKSDEFNCIKAIAGIALGSRHPGTSPKRDANKLLHYAKRIVARLNKDS
jgi:hypothetical protein